MENKKVIKSYRKAHNIKAKDYYFSKSKNIFLYILNILKYIFMSESPLYAKGTHIINGYPGAGKTLLMNKIIQNIDSSKYFFYSNIDEFNQENVYSFDLNNMFNEKKQIARFRTKDKKGRYCYGVIFDEINLQFNKRGNGSKEYNSLFIGLIEFIVTHRHQEIPRVYFIGQKLELQDTQLISLFKYQHDIINAKKRFRYWKYYESFAERVPKKLYIMDRVKNGEDIFTDWKKERIKITWRDLQSYDTLALGKIYKSLPLLKTK